MHNCFNPLWLPSLCSPDSYNELWLLTTQKWCNLAKFQNVYDNFLKSVQKQLRSRHNFFQLTLNVDNVKKKFWGKLINQTHIFGCGPGGLCLPRLPIHIGDKILKIPLVILMPKSVIVCLSCLNLFFLQNSWSCPQVYCGAGCQQKALLDGATDFL